MKRTGIALILFLIITAALIGCGGGGGGGGSVEDPISISPKEVTLLLDGEQQFTATVIGLSDQRVTWSATGGKIYEDGLYWATEVGDFEVIATSKADPSKKGSAKVHVRAAGIADDFYDIEAWQGYVTYSYDVKWNTGQGDLAFSHKCRANIKREYRLEEQGDYWWRRLSDSPIVISGSIYERSEDSNKPTKYYMETNWNGQFSVAPKVPFLERDYLMIDNTKGTYSIVLYGFGVDEEDGSPIITERYEDGYSVETWKNYSFPAIEIIDQPLPSIGKVLSGSKTEMWELGPIWYGTGADDPKVTEVTITWQFTPAVKVLK